MSAFEDLADTPTYDAVVCCTAWHWLAPGVRTDRAAAMLRPGGSLVTVDTHHVGGDDDAVFDELQRCYVQWDPATRSAEPLLPAADVPTGVDEVDTSPLFARAERLRVARASTYSRAEYLDLLMTYSGHRALRTDLREGLLTCIGDVIDAHGGAITKDYLYELLVAHRTS